MLRSETVKGLTLNLSAVAEQLFSSTAVIPREEDRVARNVQRVGGVFATSLSLGIFAATEEYGFSEIFGTTVGIAVVLGIVEMLLWRSRVAAIDRAYHSN